jgi:hypothetical protein
MSAQPLPMLDHPQCLAREVELLARIAVLEADLRAERAHADRWQKLAGSYDDIRYALRNAPDTPEGHAKFYDESAELIFGTNPT